MIWEKWNENMIHGIDLIFSQLELSTPNKKSLIEKKNLYRLKNSWNLDGIKNK